MRRCEGDDRWSEAAPLKAVLNKCWPVQKPIALVDRYLPAPRSAKRRWTAADRYLVDEANTLLNGTPFTYAHVVVDDQGEQRHAAASPSTGGSTGRRTLIDVPSTGALAIRSRPWSP